MTEPDLGAYRKWASEPLQVPPTYSVVIPAYNEEFRIIPTIGAIASHMCTLGEPWEMIVADDGSTDTTAELVADLGLANLHLLLADANGGKGSAVRRGIFEASGEIVLFADADQSTPIEQFEDLLAEIHNGFDVAVGSRAAVGADVASKSLSRKVFSFGLKTLVQTLFRIPVSDTQCGFKMFTSEAALLLFTHQVIDEFSFDLEILFLAKKFGFRTAEVPVTWIDAPGSKVDAAKVAVEFVKDLVAIRRNAVKGMYDHPNHDLPKSNKDSIRDQSGRQAA